MLTIYHSELLMYILIKSSNGSIFPRYWPFVREFTGHRWIPLTKGLLRGLWYFFDVDPHKLLHKHSNVRWFETTWHSCDVIVMWRHWLTCWSILIFLCILNWKHDIINVWGRLDSLSFIDITFWSSHNRRTRLDQEWGSLKLHSLIEFFESHSYLTGVTAAELRWHMPNIILHDI